MIVELSEPDSKRYFRTNFRYQCVPLNAKGKEFEDEPDYYDPASSRSVAFKERERWCTDTMGPRLLQKHISHYDEKTRKHFDTIEIDDACRWSSGHSYFCFRHPEDAMMFKLMFNCEITDTEGV